MTIYELAPNVNAHLRTLALDSAIPTESRRNRGIVAAVAGRTHPVASRIASGALAVLISPAAGKNAGAA